MAGRQWWLHVRRAGRGHLGCALGVAVLLGALVAPPLSPAIVRAQAITVPSGDIQGLKNAINMLNGVSGPNTITLADTGDYPLTASDNGAAGDETGLPVITGNITITGPHPTIRRDSADATPLFRLFSVASGGTLHLDDLILSNGAIRGSVGLTGSPARAPFLNGGPGLTGSPGVGAAVKNDGTLIVSGSLFTGNNATGGQGGHGGSALVNGSGGRGGVGGDGLGGAIYSSGALTIVNSTFTANTAAGGRGGTGADTGGGTGSPGDGGNGGNGDGGAIATAGGGTVANATIAANTGTAGLPGQAGTGATSTASPGFGAGGVDPGGVDPGGGTTIANTILAGNIGSAANRANCAAALAAHDGGHNLEFNPATSCTLNTGAPTFDVLADPKLSAAPIFDFVSTNYFSIGNGSAALGAGDAGICTGTVVAGVDQRGKPRAGSTCDIGAVEAQGHFTTGPLPAFFTAGVPFAIGVAVVSEFGGPLTKYAGTLHTFSGDPLASVPADYTFTRGDAGAHDFPITFGNAGQWSVIISERVTLIAVFAQPLSVGPAFVGLSPPFGSPSGGTTVTLTGAGFVAGTMIVTFGSGPDSVAATITSVSNTRVIVTTPAHAEGKVAVTVVSNGHGARTTGAYTYGTLQVSPIPRPPPGDGLKNPAPHPPPRPGSSSGDGPPTPLPNPR